MTEEEKQKKAKRKRELKKLQENIVKDALPLPSRRSLKRVEYEEYDTSSTVYNMTKRQKVAEDSSTSRRQIVRTDITVASEPPAKKARRDLSANSDKKSDEEQCKVQSSITSPTSLKLKFRRKKKTTKSLTRKATQDESDDEWEDIEENSISANPPVEIKKEKPEPDDKVSPIKITELNQYLTNDPPPQQPKPTRPERPPRQAPIPKPKHLVVENDDEFKIIENVAFSRSRNAVIFECRVNDCMFQSHHKHTFNQHAKFKHVNTKWSGFCQLCGKMIIRGDKAMLVDEIVHLHDHLLGSIVEKSTINPELLPAPPSSVTSATQPPTNVTPLPKAPTKKIVIYPDGRKSPEEFAPVRPIMIDTTKPAVAKETQLADSIDQVMRNISHRRFVPLSIRKISTSVVVSRKYNGPEIMPRKYRAIAPKKTTEDVKNSQTVAKTPAEDNKGSQIAPIVTTPTSAASSPSNANKSVATIKGIVGKRISISSITGLAKMMPQMKMPNVQITVKPSESADKSTESAANSSAVSTPEKATTTASVENEKVVWKNDMKEEKPSSSDDEREQLYHEALRPWLNKRTLKNFEQANKMKSASGLHARFKCMASTCSYFTTVQPYFQEHLSYHNKFTPADFGNFRQCSYCSYEADFVEELVDHIVDEHGYDKFHCAYCFYRSCHDFNVAAHQDQYHKMKDKKIVMSNIYDRRDLDAEIIEIEKKLPEFVPPIPCVCKFYYHFLFSFESF